MALLLAHNQRTGKAIQNRPMGNLPSTFSYFLPDNKNLVPYSAKISSFFHNKQHSNMTIEIAFNNCEVI
jgi:hypothetical protein